jgi:methionyl-tRNA formyltransferase
MTRPLLMAIGRSELLHATIGHLIDRGFRFGAIVTAPPNPEYAVDVSDFASLAERARCEFLCARTAQEVDVVRLARHTRVTTGITANWRYIFTPSVLDAFPGGMLNLHLGNLPDYRGNATVNWAILQGEDHIDANVHRVVAAVDAGDVIARARIEIGPRTRVGEVLDECLRVAPQLFEEALLADGRKPVLHQAGAEGRRCYPRRPEDGLIDWSHSSAAVDRLVRATSRPYGGAYAFFRADRLVVWRAEVVDPAPSVMAAPGQVLDWDEARDSVRIACGDGAVDLLEIELDGKEIRASQLTRSVRDRLTSCPDGTCRRLP